jgi:hypothetical protein
MRRRALLIWAIIILALVPIFYINRALKKALRPRENAGRFFLYIFSTFLLVVVYTMSIVALIVRLFPTR